MPLRRARPLTRLGPVQECYARHMMWRQQLSRGGGYPLAVGAVGIAALIFFPLRGVVSAPVVMLFFVPIIVAVARIAGTKPSATAAALAFLFLDLLYIPPYYRLTIASLPEWIGLMVFLVVALISGQQTGRLREREQAALRRQAELELLNRLTFRIASEYSLAATAEYVTGQLTVVGNARRVALYRPDGAGNARCVNSSGESEPATEEARFAEWVLTNDKAVGPEGPSAEPGEPRVVTVSQADALPGVTADAVYLPLQTVDGLEGVLVAQPVSPSGFGADESRLLISVANLTAAAFERERLADEAAHSQALRETDRMKTTLVSSVSHELKTPLAAATARVTGLVEEGSACDEARVRSELEAVSEDLARLDSSIGDLLDLSRLESDAWRPRLVAEDVSDILGTALSRLPRLHAARIRFDLSPDLPPVSADFAQLARAFVNLMENALAYAPADSSVLVSARSEDGAVRVVVEDRGPGVPDAEKARVFEKFFRGSASSSAPAGTGLGLAIATEIVRSHHGTLVVEDADPVGARFVMTLPTAGADSD
ncbi:MAG: DUF4118 domain-containing protein [Coriobacteriia bacterium]|nr:DUF4118 domain-containing protein [Coriobacteriia bacterium]